VHPGGGLAWCYSRLIGQVDDDRPIYGLQARGLSGPGGLASSVEEMADDYVAQIRGVQPKGPYHLLGWSFGGAVAHAMAVALAGSGERVALLALLDTYPRTEPGTPGGASQPDPPETRQEALAAILEGLGQEVPADGADVGPEARTEEMLRRAENMGGLGKHDLDAMVEVFVNNARLVDRFRPRRFPGSLLFLSAGRDERPAGGPAAIWRPFVAGRIEEVPIDATHHQMLRPDAVTEIGAVIGARLRH
jgi:thioesterase domain-containing protein